MKLRATSALMLSVLMLAGCATSSISYVPPSDRRVINTMTVNQSFDQVWDRLVRQLSSDFFVINNIDKNSRLINVSFTTKRPSDFVDCGVTTRQFKNARGDQNYTYNTADSASFTHANQQGHVFNVNRNTTMEGRTNIYVAPEGQSTLVSVNSKYVVTVSMSAVGIDGRPVTPSNLTMDFSTKQGYISSEVTCYALGTIEQKILRFVTD